ncbi:RNA-binding CRS1 / YhbY (CRM) domain-containing protein [Actinidia rufa]|uniref:RNA-binding CRS1 / YhbY (CRM) domain-containing protein n=1 Tax=Actinidia rufa TaxID=165716 RepID=A0A7J0DS68_9ERIC|nr:RNA-binding CRS1 / YhbY (CRM) domain-containing protein [Actinidia rufa]
MVPFTRSSISSLVNGSPNISSLDCTYLGPEPAKNGPGACLHRLDPLLVRRWQSKRVKFELLLARCLRLPPRPRPRHRGGPKRRDGRLTELHRLCLRRLGVTVLKLERRVGKDVRNSAIGDFHGASTFSASVGAWAVFGIRRNVGARGNGRRSDGPEGFVAGGGGWGGGYGGGGVFVNVGNFEGGVEALEAAELVFDGLLGALFADELLGVGVVPLREADFGGGAAVVVLGTVGRKLGIEIGF